MSDKPMNHGTFERLIRQTIYRRAKSRNEETIELSLEDIRVLLRTMDSYAPKSWLFDLMHPLYNIDKE